MNYPTIFTYSPIKLKRNPEDAFTMKDLREAIRAGVRVLKILQETEK